MQSELQHDWTAPHPLRGMTLADAQALLARINYRANWSVPELIEAAQRLPLADRPKLQQALRITAAAELQAAHEIEVRHA